MGLYKRGGTFKKLPSYKSHRIPFTSENRHVIHWGWWGFEWYRGSTKNDLSRITETPHLEDSAAHRLKD